MDETIRSFIALKIYPSSKFFNLINYLKTSFHKEKIKWVEEDNLHLTIKFLGDTSLHQVEQVKSVLFTIGEKSSPFHFDLKGVGFFQRNRQPKVLFVNIEEKKIVTELAAEIDNNLFEIGFEREERDYNPHLTIGRIKYLTNKSRFYEIVEELESQFIQEVKVNELIYFQSRLTSNGPIYKPIVIVGLK